MGVPEEHGSIDFYNVVNKGDFYNVVYMGGMHYNRIKMVKKFH
jgi:hypothetical protein